jgi:tripeptidyl-peptidase-1
MTPACLESLYGIPMAITTRSSNTIGVSGFNGELASQSDLAVSSYLGYFLPYLDNLLLLSQTFLQLFRPDLVGSGNFSTVSVDGGVNPQGTGPGAVGVEANLDIQYTVGIASGVPATLFAVDSDNIDGLIDIANAIRSQSVIPNVWTTSYGFNEQDLDARVTASVFLLGSIKIRDKRTDLMCVPP